MGTSNRIWEKVGTGPHSGCCDSRCWYIAKRRGQMVRYRNRCTGQWDGWMLEVPHG